MDLVNIKESVRKRELEAWLKENPDNLDGIQIGEDGVITLVSFDPFKDEGEQESVVAHIEPGKDEFYFKASLPEVK